MRRPGRAPRRPKTRHPSYQRNRVKVRRPKRRRASLTVVKHATSPEAKRHKKEYDTKYESTPEQKKYHVELRRERRKRGIDAKGGPDMSHTKEGTLVAESPHTNRARHFKERGTLKSTVMAFNQLFEYDTITKSIEEGTSFDLPASHWAKEEEWAKEADEGWWNTPDPSGEESMMDEATGKVGVSRPRTRRLQRSSGEEEIARREEAVRDALRQKSIAAESKEAQKQLEERLFGRDEIDTPGAVPGGIAERLEAGDFSHGHGAENIEQLRFNTGQWLFDDEKGSFYQTAPTLPWSNLSDVDTHMGKKPGKLTLMPLDGSDEDDAKEWFGEIGHGYDRVLSDEKEAERWDDKWNKVGQALGLSDEKEESMRVDDSKHYHDLLGEDEDPWHDDEHDEEFDSAHYDEHGQRVDIPRSEERNPDPRILSEIEALERNEQWALRDLPPNAETAAAMENVSDEPSATLSVTEGDIPVVRPVGVLDNRFGSVSRGRLPIITGSRRVGVRPFRQPDFGNRTRRRQGEGPFGEPFHE